MPELFAAMLLSGGAVAGFSAAAHQRGAIDGGAELSAA